MQKWRSDGARAGSDGRGEAELIRESPDGPPKASFPSVLHIILHIIYNITIYYIPKM